MRQKLCTSHNRCSDNFGITEVTKSETLPDYAVVEAAYAVYHKALRDGQLVRPEACVRCGTPCVPAGHHEDYDRPLDVLWLCHACHVQADVARRRRLPRRESGYVPSVYLDELTQVIHSGVNSGGKALTKWLEAHGVPIRWMGHRRLVRKDDFYAALNREGRAS